MKMKMEVKMKMEMKMKMKMKMVQNDHFHHLWTSKHNYETSLLNLVTTCSLGVRTLLLKIVLTNFVTKFSHD